MTSEIAGARVSRRRNLGAALAAAAMLAVAASPVWAQDMSLGALVDRLERLERDLGMVSRQLATGEVPEGGTVAVAGPEVAARLEVRLGELEEQIRQLTGQAEEARFALRQLNERLDSRAADTDARLAAIESRLAAAPPPLADAGEAETTVIDSGGDDDTVGVLGIIESDEGGGGGAVAEIPPVAMTAEDRYQNAIRLLSQTDYAGAETAFQAIIDQYPENELAGNAHFWLGEIYMKQQDYQRAAVAYARGYKAFPDGNKAADSLLKLGVAFAAMDKRAEACATFERLSRELDAAPAHILDRLPEEQARLGCG